MDGCDGEVDADDVDADDNVEDIDEDMVEEGGEAFDPQLPTLEAQVGMSTAGA